MATSINNLMQEINNLLSTYAYGVDEKVKEASQKVAQEGMKKLKQSSNTHKTGDYNKGWRVKKEKGKLVIHNATDYQLTHLLEKGHAKVGGGRVNPRVHIKPVEDEVKESFTVEVMAAIRS